MVFVFLLGVLENYSLGGPFQPVRGSNTRDRVGGTWYSRNASAYPENFSEIAELKAKPGDGQRKKREHPGIIENHLIILTITITYAFVSGFLPGKTLVIKKHTEFN